MSSHSKGMPIRGDFCGEHLRFVMSCSDSQIEQALAALPNYDQGRLRRILRGPVKGLDEKTAEEIRKLV